MSCFTTRLTAGISMKILSLARLKNLPSLNGT